MSDSNDHGIDRRTFLKGACATAASAAAGLMWKPQLVLGAETDVPKRVVFFHGGWGGVPGYWEPKPAPGNQKATATDWQLNELFEELGPYRDRMIMFENLDMVTDEFDPNNGDNAHYAGSTHELSAAFRTPDGKRPGDITIDQYIAKELSTPMPKTPLRSLHVFGSDWQNGEPALRDENGNMVPSLLDPEKVYQKVFPEQQGTDVVTARGEVFKFVEGRNQKLRDALGKNSREKLEQHLQTRRDIEKRLEIRRKRLEARPDSSMLDEWENHDHGWPDGDAQKSLNNWQLTTDLNMELTAAALHADVTRVATVAVKNQPISHRVDVGKFDAESDHDLSHKVLGAIHDRQDGEENTYLSRHPDSEDYIVHSHKKVVEKLRTFLDMLDQRTEPDGQSLLDHTMVVFTSQIADGSHSLTKLPWMIIGDGQGELRTGRYVRSERRDHPSKSWLTLGRPHNDMFVSVARAMGIQTDTFGNSDVCNGRISEIHRM